MTAMLPPAKDPFSSVQRSHVPASGGQDGEEPLEPDVAVNDDKKGAAVAQDVDKDCNNEIEKFPEEDDIFPPEPSHKIVILDALRSRVYFFDLTTLTLSEAVVVPKHVAGSGVVINNDLYVLTGSEITDRVQGEYFNTNAIDVLNLSTLHVSRCTAKVPDATDFTCSVAHGHTIIIIGGYFLDGPHKRVHVLDLRTLSWSSLPDLINSRYECRAIVHRNRIFVVSGGSKNGTWAESAEVYSYTTGQWTAFAARPRWNPGLVIYQDLLYVFGGIDTRYAPVEDVDVYDVSKDDEQPVLIRKLKMPLMDSRYGDCAVTESDGRLFAFQRQGVAIYDVASKIWTKRRYRPKNAAVEDQILSSACFKL
jgi:hypothetical protein